ncbi:hypothetical protein NPM20_24550, partial [Vibrio parahaemolyticus]|uniref:hypothetical protein n=1 Tax=Vibrio parahaemolyticus TaxID=670 RepID=UPI0021127216
RLFNELWDMANKIDVLEMILEQDIKVEEPSIFSKDIINFKADLAKKTLGHRGREVLNRLMPKVFDEVFAHPDAQFGLPRVL